MNKRFCFMLALSVNIFSSDLHKALRSCHVKKDVISRFLLNGYDPNYLWTRKWVRGLCNNVKSLLPPSSELKRIVESSTTALDELVQKAAINDSLGREIPSATDVEAVELLKEHGALFGDKEASLNIIDSIISGRYSKRPDEIENARRIKELIADIGELPKL